MRYHSAILAFAFAINLRWIHGYMYILDFMEYNCESDINMTYAAGIIRLSPDHTYSTNLNCTLTVRATPAQRVSFTFNYISISSRSAGAAPEACSHDRLTVYDGESVQSHRLIGPLCGYKTKDGPHTTSQNAFTLHMLSDENEDSNAKGFEIIYTAYHTGSCEPSEFHCSNGHCLSKQLNCDSVDNCGDASDEQNETAGCPERGFSALRILAVSLAGVTAVIAFTIAAICCTRARKLAKRVDRINSEVTTVQASLAQPECAAVRAQHTIQHDAPKPYQLTTFVMNPGVYAAGSGSRHGATVMETSLTTAPPHVREALPQGMNLYQSNDVTTRLQQARYVQTVLSPYRNIIVPPRIATPTTSITTSRPTTEMATVDSSAVTVTVTNTSPVSSSPHASTSSQLASGPPDNSQHSKDTRDRKIITTEK